MSLKCPIVNKRFQCIIAGIQAPQAERTRLSAAHRLLRFGVFELNLDTEEVRKEGVVLKLGPQPFKVLAILAGRSGQIVGREELREAIWDTETYVDFEHGLNQCIKQIRTVLNDNSTRPLYIETLPRKGYRFLAPVTSKTIAVVAKVTPSTSGIQPRVSLPAATNVSDAGPPSPSVSVVELKPVVPKGAASLPEALEPEVSDEAAFAEIAAPEPSRRSRVGRLVGWLAVPALALIGIFFYWHSQNANALMERDTVVLADFENSTGDPVFDDTLKQALRIQLEQSPFINLVDDHKVISTLKLTGRSAGDRLTPDVARDVCQRMGSKAMLTGSIAELGTQYVIGLKAVNCLSGDLLTEAQEQAQNKEQVLKALDRAATNVRHRLGESLRSVENFATPVEEATTPSLEALKAYSLGRKMAALKGDTASLPLYQRAIGLDPNFAMAYQYMAAAYMNLNEVGLARESEQKAYDLREKVSEREKLLIEGQHYLSVTGELEKAAQTYELGKQAYPKDPSSSRKLVLIYSRLGDYEKAAAEVQELLQQDPNNGVNYSNLAGDYENLNRLQAADAVYQQALERGLDGEWMWGNRYVLAFLQGDTKQMADLLLAARGVPGTEDLLLAIHGDTQAWYGKLHNARELTRHAMDSAERNNAKETAASYQAAAALREVESGDRQQARDEANAALKLAPNRDVQAMAALALARAGDTADSEKLASVLNNTFPLDTLVQKYWLPSIRAAIALDRNQPAQAVELLKPATSLELASPTNVTVFLCPPYLRGQAYFMLGQGGAARAEFQKLIDHSGLAANFQWAALARLGIARAYALEAETDPTARDKARTAYQDFLTLWKDADPDIPIYQQAKAEYAKLQ
jgi:DNA-binding winged helix-turn-helix (wHTH) protein/tetratricopeptide (TPR) repeat protein